MTAGDDSIRVGRLARISGQVRAGAENWELGVQRVLLEDGREQAGDAFVVERVVTRVAVAPQFPHVVDTPLHRRQRVLPRALRYAVGAALGTLSLGAAAFGLQRVMAPPEPAPVVVTQPKAATPLEARLPKRARAVPPKDVTAVPKPSATGSKLKKLQVPADAAPALYAAAKQARRSGKFALASSKFLLLQRRFPASAEAQVSRVLLGGSLLASGNPVSALAQYDAYLQRGGPMTLEALVGRARALAALGRTAEERTVWQTVVRRYPKSVHAARARSRLEALRGSP
jgi:TolA-binding protein